MTFNIRPRTAAIASVAVLLFAAVNFAPASADASTYCQTEEGMQDPRCKPDYCRQFPDDPYCADPHYCERAFDDPICQKGEPEPKKELCIWYVDGAPVGSVVPVLRQSNPGPHVVRLECPNHAIKDWTCKEKSRDGSPVPSTNQDLVCTYHGSTVDATSCASTAVWTVMVPDFNTWTVELSVVTYKVKPVTTKLPTGEVTTACVGPVDWNTTELYVQPDGTLATRCVLENTFLAKDFLFKSDGMWHHYERNAEGGYDHHTHPNLPSQPDGKIDACDLQHYSIQWRQWN